MRFGHTQRLVAARQRSVLCCAVLILALAASAPTATPPSGRLPLPNLMLWAWERPEDLRGLRAGVGVAFLAQTLTIRGERVETAPRRQPLRVDAQTALVAVSRIEVAPGTAPGAGAVLVETIARAVADTRRLPRIVAVQIDFDATRSERDFYRRLLRRVRAHLTRDVLLSMTALASWCMADTWLDDVPVDETVPMLFRMGLDWPAARRAEAPAMIRAPSCRHAVGVSLDEPLPLRASGRRVYVFNPRPWSPEAVAIAEQIPK